MISKIENQNECLLEGAELESFADNIFNAVAMGDEQRVLSMLQECSKKQVDLTKILNKAGLNILQEAVQRKHIKMVEFLLKEKQVSNLVNYQGQGTSTPLMLAVDNYDTKMTSLLLSYGADQFIRNVNNKNALDVALENDYRSDLITMLGKASNKMVIFVDCNEVTPKLSEFIGMLVERLKKLKRPEKPSWDVEVSNKDNDALIFSSCLYIATESTEDHSNPNSFGDDKKNPRYRLDRFNDASLNVMPILYDRLHDIVLLQSLERDSIVFDFYYETNKERCDKIFDELSRRLNKTPLINLSFLNNNNNSKSSPENIVLTKNTNEEGKSDSASLK